jgi:hypothetical protein
MNEDWDTLIILDGCRVDVFEQTVDRDQLDEFRTVTSLGSHSSEWTRRNFSNQRFGDTVYVSANPHTSLEASNSFHKIFELWKTDFNKKEGVVRPEAVRDTAIKAHERFPNKRLIIHFMQPHKPFLSGDIGEDWTTEDEYWRAYADNLDHVLPFVDDIINAIPQKTVISSDHGQIHFGNYKHKLGLSGHKPRLRYPSLVRVPWAVIDGDRRDIQKGTISEAKGDMIQDRLKDLGYL